MISVWWSVLLTAVGVLGLWLTARHSYWGWAISFVGEFLWLTYAIVTRQWGFVIMALVYACTFARAFQCWRREALQDAS